MKNDSDHCEVNLLISKKAFEKAQALFDEKDPRLSILGEWREFADINEMLGLLLEQSLLGDDF